MLLIPGDCLAILHAVWKFDTFGFSASPSIGVRKAGFRCNGNAHTIGDAEGDNKIAIAGVIGTTREETHEAS